MNQFKASIIILLSVLLLCSSAAQIVPAAHATPMPASAVPAVASSSVSTLQSLPVTTVAPASVFAVTSIDMTVTPVSLALWPCGAFIQVVYVVAFHVTSGPSGGVMAFSYTTNNGRGQTSEQLTILPGQRLTDFVFTWAGSLPSDHTQPGLGGVQVSSPNVLVSRMVSPGGTCR